MEVKHLPVETQFAYGIGRIRVIEKRLLDKGKFDRMIDSKTPGEALKILVEAGYDESATDITGKAYEYEKLLREEQKKLYRLLRELTDESKVFDIFLLNNDYHNIKVILKSEFLGIEDNTNLLESVSIPATNLKMMIRERDFEQLSFYMKEAIEECIDTFNRTHDPQQIDLILDRAYFKHVVELANNLEISFIKELLKITVDLTNIKTFLRLKKLNMPVGFLQKNLMPGGKIDNNIFIRNMDLPLEGFVDTMKGSAYENICKKGIDSFINTGSIAVFEKLADDYLIAFAKKVKYKTFGIEPLIGYLLAKENELKNVRIVMVGKINNISADIIRERLRETYV
ncbi:MAG: V-type ATP synthase subunit C [Firmicutes bacterium]|nr:V-type ATP synthase subunit C [Bacillota bacterium]